jgi:hypothetical protein
MSESELALQTRRRANLCHLIQSLGHDGVKSLAVQAGIVAALDERELQALMDGDTITEALAREIEWAMHRPKGWLDRSPDDRLDD